MNQRLQPGEPTSPAVPTPAYGAPPAPPAPTALSLPSHHATSAYLDYAATTPVDPRVAARMAECLTLEGIFGNPGSLTHDHGDAAAAMVETARGQVAQAVGALPTDVIWTSGATEANNLALFGIANYYREQGRHIVTVRTEHKAVLDPCRELERRGWRVTYLEPGRTGVLDPARLAEALQTDTVLVSVMHVNNEIGVVQNIAAIAGVCAAHGRVRLHVDGAQSVGKCALDFAGLGLDLLSLSAHKAYGPKGVGALIVSRRRGVQLQPLQFGGGQERNLRSGTVATHQVVGMGAALAFAAAEWRDEAPRIALLRDRLWRGLDALGGALRNGDPAHAVAHLLNVSFEDVEGESLLAAVRPFIAVSTGSACSSAVQEPSYVLRALGRDERLAESSLRFSLGRFSTEGDVDAALLAVRRAVVRLRQIGGVDKTHGQGDSQRPPAEPVARTDGVPVAKTPTEPAMAAQMTGTPTKPHAAAMPVTGTLAAAGAVPETQASYNELTWQHFETAAYAGVLTGPGIRRGAAGSRAQGTWVQFDLRIDDAVRAAGQGGWVDRAGMAEKIGGGGEGGEAGESGEAEGIGGAGGTEAIESGKLLAVRFLAFGCPHVIAAADWIAQQAVGLAAAPALPESVAALKLRFAVPTEKLGRLLVIEDAWIAALSAPLKRG